MNSFAPYAAFFMRLAVGGVFLSRGLDRIRGGIPNLSLSSLLVLLVIAIETVGAVCVLLGMWTRFWATAMAAFMAVTIIAIERHPDGAGRWAAVDRDPIQEDCLMQDS